MTKVLLWWTGLQGVSDTFCPKGLSYSKSVTLFLNDATNKMRLVEKWKEFQWNLASMYTVREWKGWQTEFGACERKGDWSVTLWGILSYNKGDINWPSVCKMPTGNVRSWPYSLSIFLCDLWDFPFSLFSLRKESVHMGRPPKKLLNSKRRALLIMQIFLTPVPFLMWNIY